MRAFQGLQTFTSRSSKVMESLDASLAPSFVRVLHATLRKPLETTQAHAGAGAHQPHMLRPCMAC